MSDPEGRPRPGDRPRGPGHWRGAGFHRGPGFRPPWWPEGEPFPPSGSAAWRGVRTRFLRRVGLVVAVFFGLLFAANVLTWTLLARRPGPGGHRAFAPFGWIIGLGILVAFLVVGRAARGMAGPVGDVMEAADRVAGGDYRTRVEERGPREVRRLARSFNAMAERLNANEEQRRELLADVAHELRTPLSVIQGNVEGMLDGLYPTDRTHLEPLLEEARIMSRLLEDLQTLSTAEAGALRLHWETARPAELVEEAAAAFRASAGAKGVTLELRNSSSLPDVEVDPLRIGQVLANLLSNAVRHTPPGGSVSVSADLARSGRAVAFSVSDTGPGIPPDVLPHVFDRFVRSGDSGGAGLGLAIARSLVRAHGGEITAESREGRGTTVRFEVPAQPL